MERSFLPSKRKQKTFPHFAQNNDTFIFTFAVFVGNWCSIVAIKHTHNSTALPRSSSLHLMYGEGGGSLPLLKPHPRSWHSASIFSLCAALNIL